MTSNIPTWLGATASQPAAAGQVNQFLGAHPNTFLYAATLQAQANTAGSGSFGSNGQYLAQSFTTGAAQTLIVPPFGSHVSRGCRSQVRV